MKKRIQQIPIASIRVVNPRDRNKHTFRGIVNNVGLVGLKKPITVFRRARDADGTEYDLVCGQGRMEAVAALGSATIPAIVTDAPLQRRYLMSLVENVARKRPRQSDLLHEVRRLKKEGYRNATIAEKLGLGKTYLDGIIHLLGHGEDRLVEQVAAGIIPLNVAITIATAGEADVQRAMSEAYEKGELRGSKLITVQRLVARRAAAQRGLPSAPAPAGRPSSKDLAREYELHTQRQRTLVKRAAIVHERLGLLGVAFQQLLADDQFVALLKDQKLDAVPEHLASIGAA